MRHSLRFCRWADGVPLGHVGGFAYLVVEAQLGALLAFHVFLRVLALQQERGITDPVIELRGVADGFDVLQAAGFGATGEHGFVVGGPSVGAGGLGLGGEGGEAEDGQGDGFHGLGILGV